MEAVLMKAGILILISVLGYTFKKLKVFGPKDYKPVSAIVMNITLPCACITAFADGYRDEPLLYLIMLFGFLGNVLMMGVGWFISRKRSKEERAFYMLSTSGYNIGAFTMPFVQSFLSPFSMVAACMFDVGNAIMCTGGTNAFLSSTLLQKEKQQGRLKAFLKKLFSSVALDAYLLMLVLSLLHLSLPAPVLEITRKIGDANGFVAMLAIGLMFEFPKDRTRLGKAFSVIFARIIGAAILALLFYFCMPMSLEIRRVLVILSFAPVSVMAVIFSEQATGDGALASLTGSFSILCSIVIILCLVLLL